MAVQHNVVFYLPESADRGELVIRLDVALEIERVLLVNVDERLSDRFAGDLVDGGGWLFGTRAWSRRW
jgi:hypothetical protein